MSSAKTGHIDTYARDALPPRELWPEMRFDRIPELAYPPRINCAVELLDKAIERGWGDRRAFRWPGGQWCNPSCRALTGVAHKLLALCGMQIDRDASIVGRLRHATTSTGNSGSAAGVAGMPGVRGAPPRLPSLRVADAATRA